MKREREANQDIYMYSRGFNAADRYRISMCTRDKDEKKKDNHKKIILISDYKYFNCIIGRYGAPCLASFHLCFLSRRQANRARTASVSLLIKQLTFKAILDIILFNGLNWSWNERCGQVDNKQLVNSIYPHLFLFVRVDVVLWARIFSRCNSCFME